MLIVGEGAHSYEAIHDWGALPDSIRYGNVHAVQVDRQGLVYVHHTVHETSASDHAVVVFDPDGAFVTSWGGQFAGGAHGMQLVREGSDEFLYFCDIRRSIVQKTDLSGNVLLTLGYPRESPAYAAVDGREPVWKPTNLAVAAGGDIYVADGYGSSYVVQYDRNGRYKSVFGGGKTDRAGDLNVPHGIAIDNRSGVEEVLTADRSNHRLQWFSLAGEPLRTLSGDIDLPCHFDGRGRNLADPRLGGPRDSVGPRQPPAGSSGPRRRRLSRAPAAGPRAIHAGPVRLPARRLFRPRRQHLRGRMGRDRPPDLPAEAGVSASREAEPQSSGRRARTATLLAILLSACSPAPELPKLTVWVWERPDDLRFLQSGEAEVAVLAATLRLDSSGVRAQPRAWPLHVNPGTPVTAVVRLEAATDAQLDAEQRALTVDWIEEIAARPNFSGLQIDFDATISQRGFYRSLLAELRPRFPRLSMTALASWCFEDDWLAGLPIDEAVPMLFRMGPDGDAYLRRLERERAFPEPACRDSIGISTDEPLRWRPRAQRLYLFHPRSWTSSDWREFLASLG